MKTIKFRVWNSIDEKFETDSYFIDCNGNLLYEDVPIDSKYYIPCFYIGILDKNGKEIYEGDILKNDDGFIGLITYRNEALSYFLKTKYGHEYLENLNLETLEIIGNQYEKAELLIHGWLV